MSAPSMTAVVARRYGPPESVEVDRLPVPAPGAGQVLVRVEAAGVGRGVLHLLTGTPFLVRLAGFGVRRPKQPVVGLEASGVVEAVGEGVTRFVVGDAVFGYVSGGYADLAIGEEAKLAKRPAGVSAVDAATSVDSASTALQAVRDHGEVQAGDRVLVLGASGGVGSFAAQVATSLGAKVTGTARTSKLDFVRSLGVADVVDHATSDPLDLDGAQPYDVIIDTGGLNPLRRLRRALAADGTLVLVGGEGGGPIAGGFHRQLLAPLRQIGTRQRLRTFIAKESHETLDQLGSMVADGTLRPPVDRVHPLARAVDALARLEAGEICGKDAIAVAA